jgi:hypothetical protein
MRPLNLGDKAQADSLRNIRSRILETKARIEANNKAALEAAGKLLEQLLQSHGSQINYWMKILDKLDDAFSFCSRLIFGSAETGVQ